MSIRESLPSNSHPAERSSVSTESFDLENATDERELTHEELLAEVKRLKEENAVLRDRLRSAEHQAHTDRLTGLDNRDVFEEEIERIAGLKDDSAYAVILLDLDQFKPVNDIKGHAKGDEALRTVTAYLKEVVRAGDKCIRLGGDELMVIAQIDNEERKRLGDENSLQERADAIIKRLRERLKEYAAKELSDVPGFGISAGSVLVEATENTTVDCIKLAIKAVDERMYEDKKRGRQRWQRKLGAGATAVCNANQDLFQHRGRPQHPSS